MNQSEFKANTHCNQRVKRGKTRVSDASHDVDWFLIRFLLVESGTSLESGTERHKIKPKQTQITFSSQLKTAPSV